MKTVLFVGMALIYFGLICYAVRAGRQQMQREAIRLGHAQYNPTNANFEWKAVKP